MAGGLEANAATSGSEKASFQVTGCTLHGAKVIPSSKRTRSECTRVAMRALVHGPVSVLVSTQAYEHMLV